MSSIVEHVKHCQACQALSSISSSRPAQFKVRNNFIWGCFWDCTSIRQVQWGCALHLGMPHYCRPGSMQTMIYYSLLAPLAFVLAPLAFVLAFLATLDTSTSIGMATYTIIEWSCEGFFFLLLVSSIAVKESACLICSVTITFVIKEVFQAHPWPCLLVD